MRFTQQEKYEIIKLVDDSDLSANRTIEQLGISKKTFYNWYARFLEGGFDGLASKAKGRQPDWIKIPREKRDEVIVQALEHETFSSRELAYHIIDEHKWFISESSVYRILKKAGLITAPAHIVLSAADEYKKKTRKVNEMWQTDFSYFKIAGWGWYFLSTVLDDYSRYIVAWDLRPGMKASDVMPSVEKALQVTGLTRGCAPKLLSDNGKCYLASEFKSFLRKRGIKAIHGRPCHPQTQGKIERYHRTMKNVVKLENYYSPEELIRAIAEFVEYYNNKRYHESLNNMTPADVYYGRQEQILLERSKIKQLTLKERQEIYLVRKAELTLC